MRVFILGLLAVSSVNSNAIRYPYTNQLLSYTPARGEFPVYNDVAQGYIRYYDVNGAQKQLGYYYPEPLYGLRRFAYTYGSDGNQLLRTSGSSFEPGFNAASYYQLQETNELAKAREEHFRRWCEQRYQALKAEMEKFNAEGLEPPRDMMAQLQPLEKIISASTYTTFGESPEIKRIRDEHLRIWNEARLKVLQQEAEHLRFNPKKQALDKQKPTYGGFVGETAEQKKAREEHLRIYNEQLEQVKKLEGERLQQIGSKTETSFSGFQDQSNQFDQGVVIELKSGLEQGQQQVQPQQQQQSGQVMDTPEVIRAREEHLRLFNEAKLRAQAEGTFDSKTDGFYKSEKIEASPVVKFIPTTQQLFQSTQQQQQVGQVMDTPEVIRAREEHLRLVNEAKIRAQAEGTFNFNDDGSYKPEKFESEVVLKFVPSLQQPMQPIQNIAILQAAQPIQQSFLQQPGFKSDFAQQQMVQQAAIQDTPEVIRAREEHLKLFNEAKFQAGQTPDTSNMFQKTDKFDTYAAKFDSTQKFDQSDRLMDAERLREAQRMREEEKQREIERLREIGRQTDEERMLEEERLRLMKEEEVRSEKERMEEAKRLKEEEQQRFRDQQESFQTKGYQSSQSQASGFQSGAFQTSGFQTSGQLSSQLKGTIAQRFDSSSGSSGSNSLSGTTNSGSTSISTTGTGFVLSSQYKNNPYLVRFASQPGTTSYIIGEKEGAVTSSPSLFYLPAKTESAGFVQKQNPFLVRFSASEQQQQQQQQQQITSQPIGSIKLSYGTGSNSGNLYELEKATREHFLAHEKALEQLRLANLRNPQAKDC